MSLRIATGGTECRPFSTGIDAKPRTQPDDKLRVQIANEFYTTLEQLSADPELLGVVGSWRDTPNDEEILEHLRSFNRTGKVLHGRQ